MPNATFDEYKLPPMRLFQPETPRYPNIWLLAPGEDFGSYEDFVRFLEDRLRRNGYHSEEVGLSEGADLALSIEHLQPWSGSISLRHAHAIHIRVFWRRLQSASLEKVELDREYWRIAASVHYEVEHAHPLHADVVSCPVCGRTGAYATKGHLVERVHDPLGVELLLYGTVRGGRVPVPALRNYLSVRNQALVVAKPERDDMNTEALAVVFVGNGPGKKLPGVVAHRGVILEAPENTMPAIQRAIDLGCSHVEIDLRYASDGSVVLMHDETLDRTTTGSGKVSESTLDELRKLKSRGNPIPTLPEAIERSRGKIKLYLDLKEIDPRPVIRIVQEMNAAGDVVFRPYSHHALQAIVAGDATYRVLIDLEDWIRLPGILPILRERFPTAMISSAVTNWTPEVLAEAGRLGFRTFANVLGKDDTPGNLRRAVSMGFDYIQTDHQQTLLEIINDRR